MIVGIEPELVGELRQTPRRADAESIGAIGILELVLIVVQVAVQSAAEESGFVIEMHLTILE
jgi:hypothetical protein